MMNMFSDFSEFLELFRPIFALAGALLNYRIFGLPLYGYLISLFVFAFVTGFIRNGSFTLTTVGNVVAGGISAGKAASAEWQRKKRSNFIGFRPSED